MHRWYCKWAKDGSEYELVREIEENTPSEKLKEELELLVVDISDLALMTGR